MNNATTGIFEIITGPMFSGKTTELIRRADRLQRAGKRVIVIRPQLDTRYSNGECIVTHTKQTFTAKRISAISELIDVINDYDAILIDEAHFFSDLSICAQFADHGKIVILAGLVGDFNREPFTNLTNLISRAYTTTNNSPVTFLTAICKCGAEAAFTARRSAIETSERIDVGGDEKYVPLCGVCYSKKITKS